MVLSTEILSLLNFCGWTLSESLPLLKMKKLEHYFKPVSKRTYAAMAKLDIEKKRNDHEDLAEEQGIEIFRQLSELSGRETKLIW